MRWLFNRRGWAAQRRRIIALGDSHIAVIRRYVAPQVTAVFDVVCVIGATAQGLVNPHSSTDALRQFQKRLDRARPWQTVLLELGEVDCGFVIWYRSQEKGLEVDDQLERSLSNYLRFIDHQVDRGFDVWVMSAPLPTIRDFQEWGEVANLRSSVAASQLDRTALTVRYNSRLREACLKRGVRFVDVSSELLDPATGVIKREFEQANRLDHHLDDTAWGDVIVRELTSPEVLPKRDGSTAVPLVARRRPSRAGIRIA